jgi:hypothetical protein
MTLNYDLDLETQPERKLTYEITATDPDGLITESQIRLMILQGVPEADLQSKLFQKLRSAKWD